VTRDRVDGVEMLRHEHAEVIEGPWKPVRHVDIPIGVGSQPLGGFACKTEESAIVSIFRNFQKVSKRITTCDLVSESPFAQRRLPKPEASLEAEAGIHACSCLEFPGLRWLPMRK